MQVVTQGSWLATLASWQVSVREATLASAREATLASARSAM
jgi:hypothetical protein